MFTLLIIDTKQLHKNVNTYVKSYISKKRLNRRREFIYICLYSVIPEFHFFLEKLEFFYLFIYYNPITYIKIDLIISLYV